MLERLVPALLVSLTQTRKFTVPAPAPALFQLYVAFAEYDWTSCQGPDDPARIQNWYSGFACEHVALAVIATAVPDDPGDAGVEETVGAAHGVAVTVSVTSTYAS